MKLLTTIIFWLLFIAQAMFTYFFFPYLNINTLITFIPILGYAGWAFRRSNALLAVLLAIIYCSWIISGVYADIAEHFVAKASGAFIFILVAFLTSKLRADHEAIKLTNFQLDKLVSKRDAELNALTQQLLNDAERRRVSLGQELHDGIGQQLTAVSLLSTSIADQLQLEDHPSAHLSYSLIKSTQETHNYIRRLARFLFPIRITQVGISAALSELESSVSEILQTDITIETSIDDSRIPESLSLQLYRICQEATLHKINTGEVHRLSVCLTEDETQYLMEMTTRAKQHDEQSDDPVMQLIMYRLKLASGSLSKDRRTDGTNRLSFRIPKQPVQI